MTGRPDPLRIDWIEDLDAPRDEWNRLAAEAGNVFATWEWASHWWRHYGRDGQRAVAAVPGPDGRYRALLPLVTQRWGPVRTARFIGHGTADELGPVCAPADRPTAARALRSALDETGCHVLLAEHLTPAGDWATLLDGTVLRREGFPLVRSSGGWEAYLGTRSRNWRKKHREIERRLRRDHELRFRLAHDPVRLDADVDELVSLYRMRWPQGSEFLDHVDFHRDLAHTALRRGWLRLWFLHLDGQPAACSYGFRFAGIESGFVYARDPRFERQSVGTMLHVHVMREALAEGAGEYRFLRGDDAYKYRFSTDDPQLVTVGIGQGTRGRAALAAGVAVDRLAPLRRRLLPAAPPAPAAP
ncbi:MAG TPA: GNAT family N-acetyltransferase [Acidimicrobiales bacterium]